MNQEQQISTPGKWQIKAAPYLSLEEELAHGELIQKKLAAEYAQLLESESFESYEKLKAETNGGLKAMDIKRRQQVSSALAGELNGKEIDKLMGWADSLESFGPEAVAILKDGWTPEKIQSFETLCQKRGISVGIHAGNSAMTARERSMAISRGNRAADSLVRSNVKLVYSEANKQARALNRMGDFEEMASAGLIGLWKAVLKYDPRRGNKFSTVATHWIRQSIVRENNNTSRLVRLPENRIADLTNLLRFRRELPDGTTEAEFLEQASKKFKLTPEKIEEISNAANRHTSLNKPVGDDGEKELLHYVAGAAEPAEERAVENQMMTILNEAIDSLELDEARILSNAFKMSHFGEEPQTVADYCRVNKITSSHYRRVSSRAIARVREVLDSYGVEFGDFFD